jgi:hypothetical protein
MALANEPGPSVFISLAYFVFEFFLLYPLTK